MTYHLAGLVLGGLGAAEPDFFATDFNVSKLLQGYGGLTPSQKAAAELLAKAVPLPNLHDMRDAIAGAGGSLDPIVSASQDFLGSSAGKAAAKAVTDLWSGSGVTGAVRSAVQANAGKAATSLASTAASIYGPIAGAAVQLVGDQFAAGVLSMFNDDSAARAAQRKLQAEGAAQESQFRDVVRAKATVLHNAEKDIKDRTRHAAAFALAAGHGLAVALPGNADYESLIRAEQDRLYGDKTKYGGSEATWWSQTRGTSANPAGRRGNLLAKLTVDERLYQQIIRSDVGKKFLKNILASSGIDDLAVWSPTDDPNAYWWQLAPRVYSEIRVDMKAQPPKFTTITTTLLDADPSTGEECKKAAKAGSWGVSYGDGDPYIKTVGGGPQWYVRSNDKNRPCDVKFAGPYTDTFQSGIVINKSGIPSEESYQAGAKSGVECLRPSQIKPWGPRAILPTSWPGISYDIEFWNRHTPDSDDSVWAQETGYRLPQYASLVGCRMNAHLFILRDRAQAALTRAMRLAARTVAVGKAVDAVRGKSDRNKALAVGFALLAVAGAIAVVAAKKRKKLSSNRRRRHPRR